MLIGDVELPSSSIPQRVAELPVVGPDAGLIGFHVALFMPQGDAALPADELYRRLLEPAGDVLSREIDRRGREKFAGVAFIPDSIDDSFRPLMALKMCALLHP